jgi:hypothetical protein
MATLMPATLAIMRELNLDISHAAAASLVTENADARCPDAGSKHAFFSDAVWIPIAPNIGVIPIFIRVFLRGLDHTPIVKNNLRV